MESEINKLTPHIYNKSALNKLAELPKNVPQLWREADKAQSNAIGREIFEEVRIEQKQVVAMATPMGFVPSNANFLFERGLYPVINKIIEVQETFAAVNYR